MSKTPSKLNLRQSKFVDAYLVSGNATEAAKAAGYSVKVAGVNGPRLLKHPAVKAHLDAAKAKATAAAQSKADRLVAEWENREYLDPAQMFDAKGAVLELHKMPPEVRRCISGFKLGENGKPVELKLWSKEKAGEMLGKFHRLFVEQVELGGRDDAPFVLNIHYSGKAAER